MTERSRQDILHPVLGEADASACSHHRLANDSVLALEGDVGLDTVAVIGPAVARKDRAAVMEHDLAEDPAISQLLPGDVQGFANESRVDVSGSGHRRAFRGTRPRGR
ncbi:hypothetical protein BB934_28990 (plasmid) [Microvirga ossetica]|uniref:Uncharacterized protein n=1 Tax=Microvirga ossetica TaxID=1882682 RepID=A0A1B2EQW4_9HYPH|nr:hypothetical protein BB934_28990 [Microvirga ossetica]